MNAISQIIREKIREQHVRFVFPSETASSLWAAKAPDITGERSVALNRFLAWDRFKESAAGTAAAGKTPVQEVIRRLFAEKLAAVNARAAELCTAAETHGGSPLRTGEGQSSAELHTTAELCATVEPVPEGFPLRAVIPGEFAAEGTLFAGWLAGILPSLALLANLRTGKTGAAFPDAEVLPDGEERDYLAIEREYSAFLEKHGLFEPSWQQRSADTAEFEYYIFYPEAMEDFTEYESLLRSNPSIHLIYREEQDEKPLLYRYGSAREELRGTALAIRELNEQQGIPYTDMAVSVPGLDALEPYLLREFSLYNIPVRYRSGKPLGNYAAGRLFSLISDCVNSGFSFTAVKALVLNEHLPWRHPDLNEGLIRFGIDNNCVSGYREHTTAGLKTVDVWEEAFRTIRSDERLASYYRKLKRELTSLVSSRSFAEIRNRYFAFRGQSSEGSSGAERSSAPGFLAMELLSQEEQSSSESDAVLGRCIEELSALIRLEKEYPELVPESPFSFYLSVLREKQYVPQRHETGVSIFPYRVAAATPFACHFVINAAQNTATVLYQPLKFLRQDKRAALGITDTDASEAFFRLYRMETGCSRNSAAAQSSVPLLRISCADNTFSGWAIPHSFFAGQAEQVRAEHVRAEQALSPTAFPSPDAFSQEREWWAAGQISAQALSPEAAGSAFPPKLYPVQKNGFVRWQSLLELVPARRFNLLKEAFAPAMTVSPLLRERIAERQRAGASHRAGTPEEGLLRVSATDLNNFFFCSAFWFYRKILEVADFSLEAKLLDDASMGNLYHEILRKLFTRIRENHGIFAAAQIETYCAWAQECTEEAAREYPAFQGPLAEPLISSQSQAISRRLCSLLRTEAAAFDGYRVGPLEESFGFRQGGLWLNGKLDRVSFSPDDGAVIIDYKTGAPPAKSGCIASADAAGSGELSDFQIPMYIRLYEERTAEKTAELRTAAAALFMSINQNKLSVVVGEAGGRKGISREEYEHTLTVFDEYTEDFGKKVEALDFSPPSIRFRNCAACSYRNICRTVFSLNTTEEAHGM
ncbi:MAG: PD-(D/E)XK nuclease family protein [Spirochaetaceae bacterium]|jgi:hypothetical protein|nr:PD-(D/E)XK nuclease family protein [Spirochaetaceae bacterium]